MCYEKTNDVFRLSLIIFEGYSRPPTNRANADLNASESEIGAQFKAYRLRPETDENGNTPLN